MNNPKMKPQQGPDPQVMSAIQRLVQTNLSPLEEVIFKSWMEANQLEESPDAPFDYRGLYKNTGGKVFAPGELGNQISHQSAVSTLMQAQEMHDQQSPVKYLMDAGGDPSALGGGGFSGEPQADFGGGPMVDNSEGSF